MEDEGNWLAIKKEIEGDVKEKINLWKFDKWSNT